MLNIYSNCWSLKDQHLSPEPRKTGFNQVPNKQLTSVGFPYTFTSHLCGIFPLSNEKRMTYHVTKKEQYILFSHWFQSHQAVGSKWGFKWPSLSLDVTSTWGWTCILLVPWQQILPLSNKLTRRSAKQNSPESQKTSNLFLWPYCLFLQTISKQHVNQFNNSSAYTTIPSLSVII